MRDYIYIWNEPKAQFIVVSGLEFKSLSKSFQESSLLLLKHMSSHAIHDSPSGFCFVAHADLGEVGNEDIYSWGDFVWTDYQSPETRPYPPPALPAEEIAELLYFAHTSTPLRNISIPSLNNRFLAYAHDDGWFLKLYYTAWSHIQELLDRSSLFRIGAIDMMDLKAGNCAFWIRGGIISREEITLDVDSVLNRHDQNA